MEYNEFMSLRSMGYEEEEDDSPNLTWGGLRETLPFLNPNLPLALVEVIIWKHLASQPSLHRVLELRLVSKHFQEFLNDPDSLGRHPICESYLLQENCVQKLGCQHRNGNLRWGAEDALQGRVMPIPISSSSRTLLCRDPTCTGSEWSSFRPEWMDGWRVSSGHGGEPGLIYLLKTRASASASNCRIPSSSITEWVVLNPVTKSRRHLPLSCLGTVPKLHCLWSVDKFSSGYVSWAGDRQMYPLVLDLQSNTWKRIGSGFETRSRIRVDKAVQKGFVYFRYENESLKRILIVYNIRQESFCEKITTGLSRTIKEELIFQHAGHVYLVAEEVGRFMIEKNVVVYELDSMEWRWIPISRIPLINFYPAVSNLTFFRVDHELVVARLVTPRRTDGVHISFVGRRTCTTVSYDLTKRSWRKDEPSRLPPDFDLRTTRASVFMPSLDAKA